MYKCKQKRRKLVRPLHPHTQTHIHIHTHPIHMCIHSLTTEHDKVVPVSGTTVGNSLECNFRPQISLVSMFCSHSCLSIMGYTVAAANRQGAVYISLGS